VTSFIFLSSPLRCVLSSIFEGSARGRKALPQLADAAEPPYIGHHFADVRALTQQWTNPMDSDSDYFIHQSAVADEGCEIGAGTKVWHFCHLFSWPVRAAVTSTDWPMGD